MSLTRRTAFLGLTAALFGSGAALAQGRPREMAAIRGFDSYGPRPNERFPMDALDVSQIDEELLREQIVYATSEAPGTVVVDTENCFLYLVQPGGLAMRYGIGVGKEGMEWSGRATIARRAEWPRWTPTKAMIERDERNLKWAGGMDGGPHNPLGARALYLYQNGRDTHYRIHGTNEPWTIGEAVSSGCIRMLNHDIIDLYNRVPNGATVVVLPRSA